MRIPTVLALLFVAACGVEGPIAVVGLVSIATIQRTPIDAAVSVASGRDCSIVRLDRGQTYCRPIEAPPPPPPFCTRSLGRVDCWRAPPLAIPYLRGIADGPETLTPEQEAHRTRRWPGLW